MRSSRSPSSQIESIRMSRSYWIKLLLAATALIFAALMAVELLKGHGLEAATSFSLVWSFISGAIFTGARYYHWRRGQQCAICGDPPVPK
jgi:hypothetical protein